MQLSHRAIERPRVVLVGTLLVLLLALYAAFSIPIQRSPAISKALVMVAVPYPGAEPGEVEDQITRKIEDALQTLDRVDFITSTSMRGSSVTQVVFLDGVEPKEARNEVAHLIDEIRRELPVAREVQPSIREIDFENMPLMLVNILAPDGFDERALKQISEDIQDEMETIPGVANTQLYGGREREIHVNLNPELLASYRISFAQVREALAAFHAEMPGGSLESSLYDYQIETQSKFRELEDIRQAVVAERGGRLIHLSDIAEVKDTYRRLQNVSQLDGRGGATLIVNKEPDINTLATAKAVKERAAELQKEFPHLDIVCTRDVSQEISVMFYVLGTSFVFGALLVLLILAWVMGLRISFLVLSAIPLSSAIALVFLLAADIPLSNMVIFSFILVLGMVVDGAIIVAENIHRHLEMGEPPELAAKNGIDEVGLPVIAADVTTVAAYLPMLLVPGIMGDFMGTMPKVVSMALLGSVLVDHFFIPVVAAYVFRQKKLPAPETNGHAATRRQGLLPRIYERTLSLALSNRWLVLLGTMMAVVGAYALFKHIGFVFFPASDRGQFEINFELPLGYSIEETIRASQVFSDPLEEMKQESDEIVHYVTAIGATSSLANRLENDPANGPEFGRVMVELLTPMERERTQAEVIADLRSRIKPWPGMKYRIEEVKDGPPGGADVAVRLSGKNLSRLGKLGEEMLIPLDAVPDTVDVSMDYRPDNPTLKIDPFESVVGMYGMTSQAVAQAVQTVVLGDSSIEIPLDDEDVTLRLQVAPEFRSSVDDVRRMMLTAPNGQQATIDELASFRRDRGVYAANRYQRRPAVLVRANLPDGAASTSDDVFATLRSDILPRYGFEPVAGAANATVFLGTPNTPSEGIRAEFTGENEERDKNFVYLMNSMILAVILIFSVLVLQFNSFRQTVVVLATVPLSFIGVIVGMWLCNFPFSLASFIGLVALTGIVVNDAIVLVDFTNQGVNRGLPLRDAIMAAGKNRLRPVILTTVTTIGGLLPLLMNLSGGAEFWQPLTGAIVFGLAFATILTLVVIPVCYSLAYSVRLRRS